ncbi:hypothetical protein NDU88_003701 [Pleurodeles waltl]|uniref:Uncharacterized protein n=1 Tax=Pleurodeles waltl TaxID=8319 RepID=A0AAV7MBU7_PLEWA|nr:hypothetical protein NDU88_003701 [Pleurodeles waltl]
MAQPGCTCHVPSQASPARADRTADREPHSSVLGRAPPPRGAQRQDGGSSPPPLPHIMAPPPVLGPGMAALGPGGGIHQVHPETRPSVPVAPLLPFPITWSTSVTSVGCAGPPTAPSSTGPHHTAVTTVFLARQQRARAGPKARCCRLLPPVADLRVPSMGC